MKRVAWSAVGALAVAAVAVGLWGQGLAGSGSVGESPAASARTLVLGVERITCGSCEARIHSALEGLPGVRAVAVDLAARTVAVAHDPESADPRALAEAVTRAGYPARFLGYAEGPLSDGARSGPGSAAAGKGCGGGCCPG
ncbi:MAG: heavy-metal-associated domain-containing protein [Thermodesulfobacteriota bacterium]